MLSSLKNSRGLFIVLEGLDGSGKTSIARMIIENLSRAGIRAVYTYEPYDSLIVRAIKGEYAKYRDAYVDALAYALDRLIHWKTTIEPALREGAVVVCDRYFYSSVAYQTASGAPYEWVLEVNRYAPRPDIAVYLDVDPRLGLDRKKGLESRFPEYERLDFLYEVRKVYMRMVREGLLQLVDSNRGLHEVFNDVWRIIVGLLERTSSS
ncbi:dTMP kinase [Thermogladius sp. 4427co]|uniref:dTMP kinase n=1 Tax=Thermogladius sp. 4427co TaxID=3450718 RepID=UPI003F792958